jgi:16S rRNA processing protein RimM
MSDTKKILVGKIVAFQGVRGDVRVQTFTQKPDDFKNLVVFGNKITPADFKFVRTVPNSSVIIAHINGFEDRTSAEALRGTELFVARDDLPDTKPGEYYQADLIGFTVIQNGEKVGIISGFQNFGAGDIIETSVGNMYSFKGAEVDLNNKTVTVK